MAIICCSEVDSVFTDALEVVDAVGSVTGDWWELLRRRRV